MVFRTEVDIPLSPWQIDHSQKILLLGSCFSGNIGERLLHAGFDADVNPLGTLYNPASIAEALHPTNWPEFSQWLHSKAYTSPAIVPSTPLELPLNSPSTPLLIITFGTAWIYRLKETGMIVANCRKQPDRLFLRERLSVDDIVNTWTPLLEDWLGEAPHIIFTVSPIRHRKDGFHENQISKSTLLLAVEELCHKFPDRCSYFPAYEIMMDELRDYRFYADDMMHPSSVAVDYIWQRFQDTYFSATTKTKNLEYEKLYKQSLHVPNK